MNAPRQAVRLETPRLVLRLYRASDFADLHRLSADPEMWTYSGRGPMGPEESWTRLLRHAGHWALNGYGLFAVEHSETGEFIGEAGCSDFRRQLGPDFDPWPEMSWAIRPDMQGHGYAVEAAQAALDWIEFARAPSQTSCLIHRDNLPSLRVAERLSYRPFRTLEYRGYPAVLMRRPSSQRRPPGPEPSPDAA